MACCAVVAALIDPGPAQAATIPQPPAACHPKPAPMPKPKPKPKPGHPVLSSFALTPGIVVVTSSAHKVTFTVKALDQTQNITHVSVAIAGGPDEVALQRVRGTARNGTWKGSYLIHRWSVGGNWHIDSVDLVDAGDGQRVVSTDHTPPWHSAWPQDFTVLSIPDVKAPTVTSLTVSPKKVNTTTATKKVHLTVKAKDAVSGVAAVVVDAGLDLGGTSISLATRLTRSSGTYTNGVWKGVLTIPRYAGSGTFLTYVRVRDFAGNSRLVDSHLPGIRVVSPYDTTNPVLKDLTFSRRTIDARVKSQSIVITAKAADALTSVGEVSADLTSRSGFDVSAEFIRVNSTGTWSAKVTIPRCSEPGTWTVNVKVTDTRGNTANIAPARLKALGLPHTLTVKALDDQAPSLSVPATMKTTGTLVVTFGEPTLWGGKGALTIYDATFGPNGNGPSGTWVCANASGTTVGCRANGADVTTATFVLGSGEQFFGGRVYDVVPTGIYDTVGNGPTGDDAEFITD